jgi:hypothetical protein
VRPFNIVTGQGFRELAQELIKVGAKYGHVKLEEILPHPTTISRRVSEMADEIRAQVVPEIKAAMERGECAATSDMWSDKFNKLHYLTMTTHYVSQKWELTTNILFTHVFPDTSKIGEHILQ